MKKLLSWVVLIPNIPSIIVALFISLRANHKKERPVSDDALVKFLTRRFTRNMWNKVVTATLTYILIFLWIFKGSIIN